jgi:hypothetical protein
MNLKWKKRVRGTRRQIGKPFPVGEKKRLPRFEVPSTKEWPRIKLYYNYIEQVGQKMLAEGFDPKTIEKILSMASKKKVRNFNEMVMDIQLPLAKDKRVDIDTLDTFIGRLIKYDVRAGTLSGGKRKPTSVAITYRDEFGIERKKRVKVKDTPEFYQQVRAKGYEIHDVSGRRGSSQCAAERRPSMTGGKFLEKLAWMLRHPGDPMPEWIPVGD